MNDAYSTFKQSEQCFVKNFIILNFREEMRRRRRKERRKEGVKDGLEDIKSISGSDASSDFSANRYLYIYKLKSPASPVEKKNWKKNIFKKFEKKYFRFVYICNCMSDHNSWTLGPIILKFWLGNWVEPPPTVPRPGLLFAWSKKVKCMTSIFYLWLILNLKKKHTQGFSSLYG